MHILKANRSFQVSTTGQNELNYRPTYSVVVAIIIGTLGKSYCPSIGVYISQNECVRTPLVRL